MYGMDPGPAAMDVFLTQTATHWRAGASSYEMIASLDCRIYSPATTKGSFRALTRSEKYPVGTIAVQAGKNVIAKDRLVCGGHTYEVIAPHSPNPEEWLHRLMVREIQQPERLLYLALKPDGYDGATNDEALPELVRVLPIPFITDKMIEVVNENQEIAHLKQLEASEIGAAYFSEANRARLLYMLVVYGTAPTAEQARDRVFPRYRFNGSLTFENNNWESPFPWTVAMVEEK